MSTVVRRRTALLAALLSGSLVLGACGGQTASDVPPERAVSAADVAEDARKLKLRKFIHVAPAPQPALSPADEAEDARKLKLRDTARAAKAHEGISSAGMETPPSDLSPGGQDDQ